MVIYRFDGIVHGADVSVCSDTVLPTALIVVLT